MTNRYIKLQKISSFNDDAFAADIAENHIVDVVSEDISGERGFIYPNTGAQRLKRNRLIGSIKNSGEIQIPMYPREATSLMYYTLGQLDSGVADANGIIKHTIKAANTIPVFQMGIGKDLMEHQYVGCAVKSMKLDYPTGEEFMGSFDMLVRKELSLAPLSSIFFPDFNILEKAFSGAEVVSKIADGIVEYVENATIEVTNNLVEDNFVLGNRYLPNLFVQGLEVSGSFDISYDDSARYQDFLDEVENKLELVSSHGTLVDLRSISTVIPLISIDTANLPTEGSDRFVQKIDWTGERSGAVNPDDAIIIEVENNRTGEEMTG